MKILIVEDSKTLAETLQEGLEHNGFAVDIVYNGSDGYKRIEMYHTEYDCVVLDRMMPEMSGSEVCRKWREHNIVIPVLMLTALGTPDDIVEGLDAGADDYMTKPFEFKVLLAHIHALLRRPNIVMPDVLHLAGLELHSNNMTISQKGKIIPLTLKEFMVLEYLMRNPNTVVSRDTLYAHAWDFADSQFSNTVDVHIKNLRKKIHESHSIIETVRGSGYRFVA